MDESVKSLFLVDKRLLVAARYCSFFLDHPDVGRLLGYARSLPFALDEISRVEPALVLLTLSGPGAWRLLKKMRGGGQNTRLS